MSAKRYVRSNRNTRIHDIGGVYRVREREEKRSSRGIAISNLEIRRNWPQFCDADTTQIRRSYAADRNVFRIRTNESASYTDAYATDKVAKARKRQLFYARPFQLTWAMRKFVVIRNGLIWCIQFEVLGMIADRISMKSDNVLLGSTVRNSSLAIGTPVDNVVYIVHSVGNWSFERSRSLNLPQNCFRKWIEGQEFQVNQNFDHVFFFAMFIFNYSPNIHVYIINYIKTV